jgi:hypothetical protein
MKFFVPDMTPRTYHELEKRTKQYEARMTGEEMPMDEGGAVAAGASSAGASSAGASSAGASSAGASSAGASSADAAG